MHTFTITVRPRVGDGWPIVAEETGLDLNAPVRAEILIRPDVEALLACVTNEYGRKLGQMTFAAEVGDLFRSARDRARERLHVRLRIEAPELRTLRWERLCASTSESWLSLALDQRTPFSQVIVTNSRHPYLPICRADLRMLAIIAAPPDTNRWGLAHFDAARAGESLRVACGSVPCDVLTASTCVQPTLDALCSSLSDKDYPLLHITCHGRYVGTTGETVIFLLDANGDTQPVVGAELIGRLRPIRTRPRLIFLNGCDTAATDAEGALGGLAQTLGRELGIPAVVAMTGRISITSATGLCSDFYPRLWEHGHVDRALSEACAGRAGRADVAAPVHALFSHLSGPLFTETPTTGSTILQDTPAKVSLSPLFTAGPCDHGRDTELTALDKAWGKSATNVVSVVALGGTGKSALVSHWVHRLSAAGSAGASHLYAWSFNAHSTHNRAAEAGEFLEAALDRFGDDSPSHGTAVDKGARLARLVGRQRTLLVLDGLEVFQYACGPEEGRLSDPGLRELLQRLAEANNGLCVTTSQLPLKDLEGVPSPIFLLIRLEGLAPEHGQIYSARWACAALETNSKPRAVSFRATH